MPIAHTGAMTTRQKKMVNNALPLGTMFDFASRLEAIQVTGAGTIEARFPDDQPAKFGTGAGTEATDYDAKLVFDGTQLELLPRTDDLCAFNIGDGTTDMDLKVFMGSTGAYVLFDNGSQLVSFIGTGIIMGAQGTGVPTSTASPFALEVHAKTSAALTAGSTGLSAGLRCRYEISSAQTNQISLTGVEGRLRIKANVADGTHSGVSGTIESDGAITYTGTSTTQWNAGNFCVELGSTCVFTSASGFVTGVCIDSSIHATQTDISNVTLAGLRIKKSSGKLAWAYGMYLDDASATTGIAIGTTTDAITIGACTDGITITGATGYALDIQTSGQVRLGVQGTGIPTATATPFAMEIHAETNSSAVLTAGDTGMSCGIRCRYEISKAQTNQISLIASEGRLRVKANIADGAHAGICGTVEADGAITFTGTATTQMSAGNFCMELGSTCVFTGASGYVTGVTIDSSIHATQTDIANVTLAGLRIKKSTDKLAWAHGIYLDASAMTTGITVGTCTTGISLTGTMTDGINFSGTYTGNVLDFSNATINPTGSSGPCFIRIGAYGSEVDYGADNDQSGAIRIYTTCSGNKTSYDRGVFACTVTTGAKGAFPIAGLAEGNNTGTGPSALQAGQFIAHLGARSSGAVLTTMTGSGAVGGMHGIWAKVAAAGDATCDSGSLVAPIWCDSQMSGTINGEEYGIYATTGASRPDGFIGFKTTSSGYDQLLYFDSTFNSGAGTCVTTDAVPGGNQDARIKVYYNGTQYYIALYR